MSTAMQQACLILAGATRALLLPFVVEVCGLHSCTAWACISPSSALSTLPHELTATTGDPRHTPPCHHTGCTSHPHLACCLPLSPGIDCNCSLGSWAHCGRPLPQRRHGDLAANDDCSSQAIGQYMHVHVNWACWQGRPKKLLGTTAASGAPKSTSRTKKSRVCLPQRAVNAHTMLPRSTATE